LAAVRPDAVLITANLPAHVPLALEALDAGMHVLLEKPFAPALTEAQQVVDRAAARGQLLMISQNYRFFPAVQATRALLREGTLGDVGMVNVDFRKYANRAATAGHRHYTIRHPLLMDMAIHHFDLMRAVLGQEPREIDCHGFNPSWSNFSDPAAAAATITFDGGAVVSYRGSWVSPGPQTLWAGEWRMECAGGEIAWTSRADSGTDADRVSVRPLGKRPRRIELPPMLDYDRAGSLRAFVRAVQSGEEPESSGRDNLGSVALMQAAIESATSGRPVTLSAVAT
jgi:predicted dehydrogenase